MKLYIGCSLAHASEAFKRSVEKLKEQLRAEVEVMEFIGLVAGTHQDVYQWDIHTCVATCDAFVAICDYPSTGLGYELGVAVEQLKKPTLALAHRDATVSRVLLGIEQPHYAFERYNDERELLEKIKRFVTIAAA